MVPPRLFSRFYAGSMFGTKNQGPGRRYGPINYQGSGVEFHAIARNPDFQGLVFSLMHKITLCLGQ